MAFTDEEVSTIESIVRKVVREENLAVKEDARISKDLERTKESQSWKRNPIGTPNVH